MNQTQIHRAISLDKDENGCMYILQQNPYLSYLRIHTILIYQHLAMTSAH